MDQTLHKPVAPQGNTQEEADRLLRLYGKTSKDRFNHLVDVEFTTWISNNLPELERLLLFIQRETARPAATKEVDVNLNAHMLAQSQILNRIYELAETGNLYKETK